MKDNVQGEHFLCKSFRTGRELRIFQDKRKIHEFFEKFKQYRRYLEELHIGWQEEGEQDCHSPKGTRMDRFHERQG